MKPRRVILTLKVKTDATLAELRRAEGYEVTVGYGPTEWHGVEVIQAQANVVRNPRTGHGDNR